MEISQHALDCIRRGDPLSVSIAASGVSGNITLTEQDILPGSLQISRMSVSGNQIELGSAISSELTMKLWNDGGKFDGFTFEGTELYVRLGINLDDSTTEYIPMGYYTVDEPPRKLSTISIKALDRMARFDRVYDSSMTYPASLYQILSDACAKCNVPLATPGSELLNSAYSPATRPEEDGITYHQIIIWIAELTGTCAWIDWDGKLRLSWYESCTTQITADDRISSDMQENDITITGVQITANDEGRTVYLSGSDTYALCIEGNLLAQDNLQSIAKTLGDQLIGFTYRPYNCQARGLPHLWQMECISYVDATGTAHSSIVNQHTYTYNGKSTIAAKGETAQRNGYATSAPLTSKERAILERMKAQTNRKLSTMQQAALELNETMANSMGLYSTTTVNPDMSVTAYWHDKPALEESQYIYTRNAGGYAWTDSGWNDGEPVWQYGVTKDGIAILNVLHVYKLTADYLDVRGLTVTNASGLETLKISPQGDVSLNVKSLSITGNQVATQGDITSGLNSLKIGSRNYIKDSVSRVLTSPSGGSNYLYMQLCTLEQGTQYTFSVDKIVRVAGTATQVAVLIYDFPNDHAVVTYHLNISNSKQQITFTSPNDGDTNTLIIYAGINGSTAGNSIRYEKMKLEKGSKATDWTPAPDDPTYGVNMILNSKKEETSNAYGFAWKELTAQLIAGQKYTLSFCGHIDQQAKNDGKSLACYVYPSDWSFSGNTTLNTTYDSETSVSFVAGETKECYFNAYLFPSGGSRTGKATLKWCKLEVGDRATDWTPAPEDRAYLVNTLSPTQADGMWLGSDGKLNITATQIKAGKLQSKDGKVFFDLDNGELRSNKLISKGNGTYMEITQGSSNNSLVGVVSPSGRTVLEASIDSSGNLGVSGNGFNWYASDMDLSVKSKVGGMSFGEGSNAEFGAYDEDGTMNTGLYFHRRISNKFDSAYFMINTSTYTAYHSGNIQCGYVDVNSNSGGSGNYYGTATVYFSPAFSKSPVPSLTVVTSDATRVAASIDSSSGGLTANSMRIRVVRQGGTGTTRVFWTAIEPD